MATYRWFGGRTQDFHQFVCLFSKIAGLHIDVIQKTGDIGHQNHGVYTTRILIDVLLDIRALRWSIILRWLCQYIWSIARQRKTYEMSKILQMFGDLSVSIIERFPWLFDGIYSGQWFLCHFSWIRFHALTISYFCWPAQKCSPNCCFASKHTATETTMVQINGNGVAYNSLKMVPHVVQFRTIDINLFRVFRQMSY